MLPLKAALPVVKLVIISLIIIMIIYFSKDFIQSAKESIVDRDDGQDLNILYARFYNALDSSWYNEDEEALYALADEIDRDTFNKVSRLYKTKQGVSLSDRLAELLSSEELQTFYSKL